MELNRSREAQNLHPYIMHCQLGGVSDMQILSFVEISNGILSPEQDEKEENTRQCERESKSSWRM